VTLSAVTAEASAIIDARGLVRTYGDRRALDGFTLAVPPGSVFGLLGPNGSGKSTFVSMVAAMELPAEGSLLVFGERPAPGLRRRVGTMFQENAQDPLMGVSETLALAGRLFGMAGPRLRARSSELLEALGMAARRDDPVSSLSGGMRRRLEIARALLHEPELLLLDEPTTGIDVAERRALWDTVAGQAGAGRTVIVATNDLSEADLVCDRVAFVREGRVVAAGTPAELKRGLKREVIRVTWLSPSDAQLSELGRMAGTGQVTSDGDLVHITVDDAAAFVPRLFDVAPGAIRSVTIEPASLEDAYFRHVGHGTRAGEGVPV
jgi:ABC-2 type transport system ATP-binding protein